MKKTFISAIITFLCFSFGFSSTKSVAREWNEVLLHAIRNDFARPTVHARNLFHASVMMYDSWALYDSVASPYFVGKTIDGFTCDFAGIQSPSNKQEAVETTLSYACYRLLKHRFGSSPGATETLAKLDSLMNVLGYDKDFTDADYSNGDYAALGVYMANKMIEYGLQDGSNEQNAYANQYYSVLNPSLQPKKTGNPNIVNPDRWQSLTLDVFIDQGGNEIPINTPEFLSPEWGNVVPFSLTDSEKTTKNRDGNDYNIYFDPGTPSLINNELGLNDDYKWGFLMVSLWSSHLDPADSVKWDISPGSKGNLAQNAWEIDIRDYYVDTLGGDISQGRNLNPITGLPYDPQIVYRGDYARVLAEFWADGPDSETPPGHWFTILNTVTDHPLCERKFEGIGDTLPLLEWDVKTYITLGGAMHDAAISAWSIKGYYDYIRPVSAIRYMADQGQSSDSTLPNYSPHGIPLVDGYCELVETGDPLAVGNPSAINKIKLYAWQGPDYISDSETDIARVGWILAENWWPYQRPSFVTPPFAGYVSGHSVFSRTAAEILTKFTGSPYFPGGMGEFVAKKNEFLVFEDGPSQDVVLQWATYQDASNESSLSRIWGGIHPPIDDVPGREIGINVADKAFDKASQYFQGVLTSVFTKTKQEFIYSNPVSPSELVVLGQSTSTPIDKIEISTINGGYLGELDFRQVNHEAYFYLGGVKSGLYLITVTSKEKSNTVRLVVE